MSELLNKIRKGLYKLSEIDFYKEEEIYQMNIQEFIKNIPYLRKASEEEIINKFNLLFLNNEDILKILFFIRSIKEGLGERRIFRILIKYLATENPSILEDNIRAIPNYGRWDDLYSLFDTPLEKKVIAIFTTQIQKDLSCEVPSTLAKWLKSENSSSKESKKLAYKTRIELNYSSKNYRKLLSALRKKLNLIEHKITLKQYENINYKKLSKLVIRKYTKAFYRNDNKKYSFYLKNKYNYEKFSPDKIITYIKSDMDANKLNENIENSIFNIIIKYSPKIDDSLIINGLEDYEDCNSLSLLLFTILLYEKINLNALKNYYIYFNKNPKFNKLSESNSCLQIKTIYNKYVNYNVDLNSAFELLLFALLKKNIKPESVPKSILFIYKSNEDMDFKLSDDIKEKWLKSGFQQPKIKLWNIKSINENFSITNEEDIIRISGYNQSIWPYLLESKEINHSEVILNKYKKINFSDII